MWNVKVEWFALRYGNTPSQAVESSGLQSGDLQGLSNVESVDSESIDELTEEGNAFEAGVVSGVEDSRVIEKLPQFTCMPTIRSERQFFRPSGAQHRRSPALSSKVSC